MTDRAIGVSHDRYIERWTEHVNELDGLRWNLTQEERDELTVIQSQLLELIENAADRRDVCDICGHSSCDPQCPNSSYA